MEELGFTSLASDAGVFYYRGEGSFVIAIIYVDNAVEFRRLKVVNQMSYLTVGSLENTSRLVDVSLNWTINSTG